MAWIHSHVRVVKCNFSSVDVHTQHSYDKFHKGVLGLVLEIQENGLLSNHDFFELTKNGRKIVEACSRTPGCNSKLQHESCHNTTFYQSATTKVMFCNDLSLDVKNFLSIQIENNAPNEKLTKNIDQPMEMDHLVDSGDSGATKPKQKKMINCEFCGDEVPATKIVLHITRKKKCNEICGQERLNALKYQKSQERKTYLKRYGQENANKMRQNQKKYDTKNAEVRREKQRVYKAKQEKKLQEKHREYNLRNLESNKMKQKIYDDKHSEDIRKKQRVYKTEHKEELIRTHGEYNKRYKEVIKTKQADYVQSRRNALTEKNRFVKYKRDTVLGPNFICFSCDKALFFKQVKIMKQKQLDRLFNKVDHDFLTKEFGIEKDSEEVTLCHKCHNWINSKNWRLPDIHRSNGLQLDDVPEEIKSLTDLEQQLIAKVMIFLKIKKLPSTRMRANFDRVISVPIEDKTVSDTISKLPRHPDDANIVAVQLKRKLEMKNTQLEEYIRPKHLVKVLKKLKELGNPFYQGVTIIEDFMQKDENLDDINGTEAEKTTETYQQEKIEVSNSQEVEKTLIEVEKMEEGEEENNDEEDDKILQNVKEFQSEQNDYTCLMPNEFSDKLFVNTGTSEITKLIGETNASIKVAPGEGIVPSNILREEHFDEKAMPKHHPSGKYGIHHERNQKLSPQVYFEQRMLNADERFSMDAFYLFMASYYVESIH